MLCDAGRSYEFQQIGIRQDANAIAVLPPSIVALRLRRILHGAVATQSRAEGKMLDVIAQSEGDPPTIWPLIHRPLVDRAVAAPVMMRKLHAILLAMRRASHRDMAARNRQPVADRYRTWNGCMRAVGEELMADLKLRLCENMRTIVYAPFYFALSGGYFARAGLAVELITSPDPSRTGHMLLEHAADVSWGGPMRVLQHHQADAACELTCFAQVVARDPFILVGHRPNPTFRFQDLPRYRVAVACEVPTPWLTLQDDLARAGVSPSNVRTLPDRPTAETVEAFHRDEVDVIQVLEPWADRLVQSGAGHVVAPVLAAR